MVLILPLDEKECWGDWLALRSIFTEAGWGWGACWENSVVIRSWQFCLIRYWSCVSFPQNPPTSISLSFPCLPLKVILIRVWAYWAPLMWGPGRREQRWGLRWGVEARGAGVAAVGGARVAERWWGGLVFCSHIWLFRLAELNSKPIKFVSPLGDHLHIFQCPLPSHPNSPLFFSQKVKERAKQPGLSSL